MAYKKVGWKDYPSTDTPINATNLDHMDAGILENAQTIGDKTKISGIGDGTVVGAIAANKSAIDANAEAIAQNTQSLTNENSETFNFGIKDGVRGFFTNPSRADDSFIPFSNLSTGWKLYKEFQCTSSGLTLDINATDKPIIFKQVFQKYGNMLTITATDKTDNKPLGRISVTRDNTEHTFAFMQQANHAVAIRINFEKSFSGNNASGILYYHD